MRIFKYSSYLLPKVTMIGRDTRCTPHRNLDRTVSEYVFYIITEGDMFFSEDGIEYHLKKGDFVTITSAIDIRYLTNNSIVFFDCTLGY